MKIHHRGLYHDRLDAPFVGSLLFSVDCHHGCEGCCHADRHNGPIYEQEAEDIIKEIKAYGFSEGIILGGFEWTEQLDELKYILDLSYKSGLKIILYTHHTEDELSKILPELSDYKGVYVKYGDYRKDLSSQTYISYGIPLASTNQYIKVIE